MTAPKRPRGARTSRVEAQAKADFLGAATGGSAEPLVRSLFGTDGIRGKANVHPMTPELALRLGKAITLVASQHSSGVPKIVIGKDTRLSGYMLETALVAGICAMGGQALLTGPIPTPAVANLTQSMRADAGVVISASHNPFEDNGIKLFGPDGYKLADQDEAAIEALLADPRLDTRVATGSKIGKAERIEEATGRYIVYAKNTFPKELALHGIRIVVDAAHGAAYRAAPDVFHELGAQVYSIGCEPNGTNINHNVGALFPEHLAREVKRRKAHLGVALDGDADRLVIVDEHGDVVDGDALMALCATRMIAEKRLRKKTLVATVMSNLGLEKAIAKAGGTLLRTPVGDRYVMEAMRSQGLSLGGEQSGHLIFSEHGTTGDGIVAALQVLAICVREGKPMSELKQVMQPLPQVLKSVALRERRPVDEMRQLTTERQRVEKALGGDGRVLIRWSGTENKLRIMLEGPELPALQTWLSSLVHAAERDLGAVHGAKA